MYNDLVKDSGKPGFQYLIRGSVAYGEVYHGCDLPSEASKTLAANPDYTKSIFIGLPITLAYKEERRAAPLGISIHETAVQHFQRDMLNGWWRWFQPESRDRLRNELRLYFEGARKYEKENYPKEKINEHERLVEEYLADN